MNPIHRPSRDAFPRARRAATGTALGLALSIVACVGPPGPTARLDHADAIARSAGLAALALDANAQLPVAAWRRIGDPALPVRVYIEGDGLAFEARGRRSDDPTPVDPVALRIAARDGYPGEVLVIARPCQYEARATPGCDPTLWTAARYGPAAVAAVEARIDALVGDRGGFDLAGFSGGGVIATLVAARRDDVGFLTTFAAPLDVAAWTEAQGVPTLALSLTPMDQVDALRGLPQQHFVSDADAVVPPAIVGRFVEALGDDAPASLVLVPDTRHGDWGQVDLDRVWADR